MNRQELQAWRNYKAAEMIEEIRDTLTDIDKTTSGIQNPKEATKDLIDDLNELRMLMAQADRLTARIAQATK